MVIGCEWSGSAYSHLLQEFLRMGSDSSRNMPIFVIRQESNHNYFDYRTLKNHSRNVIALANYLVESRGIKRLSLFGYEEGALMLLLGLS